MARSSSQTARLACQAVAGLVTLAATACGATSVRVSSAGPETLRDLDGRVSAAWPGVQRYRTIERLEQLEPDGTWQLTTAPVATDFVLPDRKYRRPAEPKDPNEYEFKVIGPTIFQKIEGQWSIVDFSEIPVDSQLYRSLQQFRTGGLDGSPFRLPPDVEGKLSVAGTEVVDGRPCRWYVGTATGPAGPVQLRVALEENRDLPCKTEAEYDSPTRRTRTAVRYFDYNAAIQIEIPSPAS